MRFEGYWVTGRGSEVEVSAAWFDDTELSEDSGWTEAWQNEDPDLPAGFIRSAAMIEEVCRRLAQPSNDRSPLDFNPDQPTPWQIRTASDLAQLVLAARGHVSADTMLNAEPAAHQTSSTLLPR